MLLIKEQDLNYLQCSTTSLQSLIWDQCCEPAVALNHGVPLVETSISPRTVSDGFTERFDCLDRQGRPRFIERYDKSLREGIYFVIFPLLHSSRRVSGQLNEICNKTCGGASFVPISMNDRARFPDFLQQDKMLLGSEFSLLRFTCTRISKRQEPHCSCFYNSLMSLLMSWDRPSV